MPMAQGRLGAFCVSCFVRCMTESTEELPRIEMDGLNRVRVIE